MAKKIKKLIKYFRKKMKKMNLELRFMKQKVDFTSKTGKKSAISKGF